MISKNGLETIRQELIEYLVRLGAPYDEAKDITQYVLLKAYEKQFEQIGSKPFMPYLKRMAKNRFIDNRRSRLTLIEDAEIMKMADFLPEEREDKALLENLSDALERHKYGYIIHEMEKRGVKKIKELAPYTNEKAETLYKRYQKLVKDLEKGLKGGGIVNNYLILNFLQRIFPIFKGVAVIGVKETYC
jgi:hypothetical protein